MLDKETLDLPLIINKIDQIPARSDSLPCPIQPRMLYTEAVSPTIIQAMSTSNKLPDISYDPRLKNILPPPITRSFATNSPGCVLPINNALPDKDANTIPTRFREKVTSIRLLLNPITTDSDDHESQKPSVCNKQYSCTFCTKKFMRPSSLKIHVYSHTGEKPFKCTYAGCRRRFSVQSNMRRHLRVHYS